MEFKQGRTVGIDLGTTFSSLAYLDEQGTPVPVRNDEGADETPSLILLPESGHVIVGPNRMRAAMEEPENVVHRVKRHMGETGEEFHQTLDGKPITPEFLSALILKKLRQDAEATLGKIGNAVITVPYFFNDVRRKATQDAGRIAGLNVIDIINEPTAATLTYAWKKNELGAALRGDASTRQVLIYDLGGGTFDVTVVRYTPTHFQVLATDGDVHLGGVDWNDRLFAFVAEQFQEKHGCDLRESPASVQMLQFDCDEAKIALTDGDEATISCRHRGKSLSVTLTKTQFEEMTADLTQRTIDTAELVLEQSKLEADQLDAIVLVGGSTLMPVIGKRIAQTFGHEPNRELSPHTSVAQGAAIHAAILEAKHRGAESEMADSVRQMLASVEQADVNSHGLGVVARNPRSGKRINHVMIPRNTPLPAEARETFFTNQKGQKRVRIRVIQGEAPDPVACTQIGDVVITDLPDELPKGSPVEVVYEFDTSGRIHIRAEDKTSGRVAASEIERAGALDEQELDAMTCLADEYIVE